MYRIAICDDEPVILAGQRELVGAVLDDLEVEYEITALQDPQKLLESIRRDPSLYHILLLDIQMEGLNGIEFAKELRREGNRMGIIFATVHKDFALDGYSVQPVQYLLKPIDPIALREALKLDYEQNYHNRHLIVGSRGGRKAIPIRGIFYIEVMGRTVTIHAEEGVTACGAKLKDLEQRLAPEHFVRCHKSYLVNLRKAETIKRYEFHLKNGDAVPISKNCYTAVQTAFIRFHNN